MKFAYCNYISKWRQGECLQLSTPYFHFFRIPKSGCFFLGVSLFFFEVYVKIQTEKGVDK